MPSGATGVWAGPGSIRRATRPPMSEARFSTNWPTGGSSGIRCCGQTRSIPTPSGSGSTTTGCTTTGPASGPRVSRVDHHAETVALATTAVHQQGPSLEGLAAQVMRRPALVTSPRPRHLAALPAAASASAARRKRLRLERERARTAERNDRYEREVFDQLTVDQDFYRRFDDTPA